MLMDIFNGFLSPSPAAGIWLFVLIAMLVVELTTVSLTSVWFAAGAFAALAASLFHAPVWLQAALFFFVSFAMLLSVRPLSVKLFRKGLTKTNVESLIGREAVVTEDIRNVEGTGAAAVGGVIWSARMKEPEGACKKGSICIIDHIEGVKLILVESRSLS